MSRLFAVPNVLDTGGCILVRSDLSTSGQLAAFTAAHALYVPPKRLQFDPAPGRTASSVNFSTIMLGRGQLVGEAMQRLAEHRGGAARLLERAA